MLVILITAAIFLVASFCYIRAYNSNDNRYFRALGSPHLKASSVFMTQDHAILFAFPPVFGAATVFLLYQHFGGEVNFGSVFLLLLALTFGPYLFVKKFNRHKQAQLKPIQINSQARPLPSSIFTRRPLSPKEYRRSRTGLLLICATVIVAPIGVFIMNTIETRNRNKFMDTSRNLLIQELVAIDVEPNEVAAATLDCRPSNVLFHVNEYSTKHCTTAVETTTKRLDLEATKKKLLQNSWLLTKQEDLGQQFNAWNESAYFQKSDYCITLREKDGPQTTIVYAYRGLNCMTLQR